MEYDSSYYEGVERAVSAEIAEDEATIGEIDTSLRLNPCENCPLVDFPITEDVIKIEGFRAETGVQGLEVSVQYATLGGRCSDQIILGHHDKSSIGSKRQAKIYEEAAKRTIECTGPKRVPRFLGPLAVKKCPALESNKNRLDRLPSTILRSMLES